MQTQRKIFTKRRTWVLGGIAGLLLLYFALPLLMGLGHMRNYSRGPSFWYANGYYKNAFLLGWRIRAGGGPTPVFPHYYNQPRYWGADIPAAYSVILFDPLPRQAEFTLNAAQVDYGGFGLYTKEPDADIPEGAWVKLEIFYSGKSVYHEDLTVFDERSREHAPVPGLTGHSWNANAWLINNNAQGVEHPIWNLTFAPKDKVFNSDWQFDPAQTYLVRLQVSPEMPELIWMARLRVKDEFCLSDIIQISGM